MSRKNWSEEKLFKRLLTNKSESTYWDNVLELRSRSPKLVFEKALELTKSVSKKEVIIGIDVLTQLGSRPRPFYEKTMARFFEILDTQENENIHTSILNAIGHNNENLSLPQISKLIKFKDSKNHKIRQSLVTALLGVDHRMAINTLIEMSEDPVDSIRNWATFGIGSQIDISNKEISNALWNRTRDKNQETRSEAIAGLAIRGENKIKDIIIEELNDGEHGTLIFDAILSLNDKGFLSILVEKLKLAEEDNTISEDWIYALKNCIEELSR